MKKQILIFVLGAGGMAGDPAGAELAAAVAAAGGEGTGRARLRCHRGDAGQEHARASPPNS